MPRKPNYRWERQERDRIKAAKKAERRKAREEQRTGGPDGDATAETESADTTGAETVDAPDAGAGTEPGNTP